MSVWIVLLASTLYVGGLFWLAWWSDRRADQTGKVNTPTEWALALAVYCTSWTYFGAVGTASTSGWEFLPIYIGPILVFVFLPGMLDRISLLVKRESITSLSDFLAARYGKSRGLATIASLAALAGTLPYIALQLKSVGWSFQNLAFRDVNTEYLPPDDTVLATTAVLLLFTIMFGARTADTTKNNVGLVRVLAFEAIVKLAALLAVCLLSLRILGVAGGEAIQNAAEPFRSEMLTSRFITMIIVAAGVIICLPRQFHITFIEQRDATGLKRARWLFPVYLMITSIVVVPIALAGMHILPSEISGDLFVLELPLVHGDSIMALFVFLGGFSAATGMVILSTTALSTMVTNDLIVPVLMRFGGFDTTSSKAGEKLLLIRRLVMVAILALAYGYYRVAGSRDALAQIGTLSFAAAIQFAPALIAGIFWRGGKTHGAIAGLSAGMIFWAYTLFLPEFIGAENLSSFVPAWLNPEGFFGFTLGDPVAHGVFWSLAANIVFFFVGSIRSKERLRDRIQAAAFVEPVQERKEVESQPAPSMLSGVTPDGLKALASRFLTSEAVDHAFQQMEDEIGVLATGNKPADWRLVQRTEKPLASALGASSARVVMSSAVAGADIALGDVLSILDQKTQAERFDRHMLQSMLENIPSGISVVDNEQKLVAWNSAYIELFQYPMHLVRVGQPISRLIEYNISTGWLDGNPVEEARRRVEHMRSGSPHRYERQSHDGRWLRITGSPMPGGGYVSIFHDITEDKKREQALLEANETLEARVSERTHDLEVMAHDLNQARMDAEGANASKTRFLAAASHDLLQPLNAARLFLASIEESENEDTREMVRRTDRAIQSADGLLKGLLDISRLDHGNVVAKPETLMLGPLLEDLADEAMPMAERAGLKLKIAPTSLSVKADPDFLQSILRNFLSNARRYTREGGVLIGARRRGNIARIEVWDTGPGIPEEKRSLLFEEFQRLDDVDNIGVRGAGLGLSVAQRLAAFMKAELDLRSVPGKGSVFSVTVPLSEDCQTKRRPAHQPKMVPGKLPELHVLCVDDEHTILDGMRALLSKWGCKVSTVSDLEAAEKIVQGDHPVDVLLADLELQNGESGLDLISALRSELVDPSHVALLTAKGGSEIEHKLDELGIELIRKPVDSGLLKKFLSECTQNSAFHQVAE